jgi:hypothetical protein
VIIDSARATGDSSEAAGCSSPPEHPARMRIPARAQTPIVTMNLIVERTT